MMMMMMMMMMTTVRHREAPAVAKWQYWQVWIGCVESTTLEE